MNIIRTGQAVTVTYDDGTREEGIAREVNEDGSLVAVTGLSGVPLMWVDRRRVNPNQRQHPRAVAAQEDGQHVVRVTDYATGDIWRETYPDRMAAYVAAAAYNLTAAQN